MCLGPHPHNVVVIEGLEAKELEVALHLQGLDPGLTVALIEKDPGMVISKNAYFLPLIS